MQNRRAIFTFGAILSAAIAIIVGWYLISPLFINKTIDEAFPKSAPIADSSNVMDEEMLEATATMEVALTQPDKVMDDPMPADDMNSMTILAQGEFYDIAHHGMGTATIYQLEDGNIILRFEDFEVLNGPEMHVYLAQIDPVPDTVGIELDGAIDLGDLKGNIGNQNYELPPDLNISEYKSVVIWCVPFKVPFNASPLNTP